MPIPTQPSLFDDQLLQDAGAVVAVLAGRKPADKAEAAFQRLVAGIEQKRELLRTWQAYTIRFNQRLAGEISPLCQEYRKARRQLAFLLDELHQANALRGKRQKEKLRRLIIDLTQDLLQEETDAELEALHDKHSGVSHAGKIEEDLAFSQSMIEDLMGVRLGKEHGAKTLDELLVRAEQEFQAKTQKAEHKRTARREGRRSARAEAAQAKREQAAKEVSQTVRDIYRKLASALHPDRETDPVLRSRKTEQMQRVNEAYGAGDLLTLLSLQLEIEQIDPAHVATLSRERLAHYNKVLRGQLAEIETEVEAVVMPFRMAAQLPSFASLTPEQVDRRLSEDLARLRFDVEQAQANLRDFRDPVLLAQFLKGYRPESGEDDGLVELMALVGTFDSPKRSGRARPRGRSPA